MREKFFYLKNNIYIIKDSLKKLINPNKIYSKFIYFLQMGFIGSIIFLIPISNPAFHFVTFIHTYRWGRDKFFDHRYCTLEYFPADVLIFVLIFFTFNLWKKYLFKNSVKYLILFIISIFISMKLANTPITRWGYYNIIDYLFMVVLICFLQYVLSEDRNKKINLIFKMILTLFIIQSIIAILQYFNQRPIGLSMIEPFSKNYPSFKVLSKKLWIFDSIFKVERNSTNILRACGTFTHPNSFGLFLCFSSYISYYFFYKSKHILAEIFYAIFIFLHFFSISISFSRAAILSYLLGAIFWFIIFFFKDRQQNIDYPKIFRLVLCIILSISICFIIFYEQFLERGGIVGYNNFVYEASDKQRIFQTIVSMKLFKEAPFWGVGLLNGLERMIAIGTTNVVHNIYILVVVESGIIGIILFFLFIKSLIKRGMSNLRLSTITILSIFVTLLIFGFFDYGILVVPYGRLIFFFIAALLNGVSFNPKNWISYIE
jgi:O-antigen ligase